MYHEEDGIRWHNVKSPSSTTPFRNSTGGMGLPKGIGGSGRVPAIDMEKNLKDSKTRSQSPANPRLLPSAGSEDGSESQPHPAVDVRGAIRKPKATTGLVGTAAILRQQTLRFLAEPFEAESQTVGIGEQPIRTTFPWRVRTANCRVDASHFTKELARKEAAR